MAKDKNTERKKSKTKAQASTIKLVQLAHARGLPLPAYQSPAAAGFDLVAAVAEAAPVKLKPGMHALIPTGLIFKLPEGTEAQVRPRSGLAVKHGVTVLNSPGTIDSDYRGEVQVILINHGREDCLISRGERIAQCVLALVSRAKFKLKKRVRTTVRGSGGFGSTGVTTIISAAKTVSAKSPGAKPAQAVKTMASAARTPRKKSGLAAKATVTRSPRAKVAPRKNRKP